MVMAIGLAVFGVIFLFVIYLLRRSFLLIQQGEAVVIERFGRFDRVLGPGLHLVVPFAERERSVFWTYVVSGTDGLPYRYSRTMYRIDLRETVFDFAKQNVITKDNVTMEISAVLYFQITDPKSALYEVSNLPEAIEKLTQTTLRNVIGAMDLDESLVSRDHINEKLRHILDDAADKWGVKVNRVELQEVNPPRDIRNAMEKQMRAERDRRAAILESEGLKQSSILEAEGDLESSVLRARGAAQARVINAEGEATARVTIAQSEARAIELLQGVSKGADPMAYLATIQYIKALPAMMEGKDNKMIVVPYESAASFGTIASLKGLLDGIQSPKN